MDTNMEHMSYTEAKKELIDIVFAIETGA